MSSLYELPVGEELRHVRSAVARLETAALAFPGPVGGPTRRTSLDEEVCDRLIDLAAARAWLRTAGARAPQGADARTANAAAESAEDASSTYSADDGDDIDEVMAGCVRWAVQEDVVRARSAFGPGVTGTAVREGLPAEAAHRLVTVLVAAFADPVYYDGMTGRLRAALGPRPGGRAAAAWDLAEEALRGLGATRDEWVGADPAFAAAGGWVLVERIGRLQLATALLAEVATYEDAEHVLQCVNAVRRYTWNWLRRPPPEAATGTHVRRTGELTAWLRQAPSTAAPGADA
ncbi:hypothetical protein [Streptomyces sp. G-G2]|uniref:hypothetical protein n=1 Tax=Streptomyces sp. G-G2 TaxID=3046201 RepID=UPI0024B9AE6E|nr:hypothetical protein [Streptomyces sp. G-G2]MDJ0383062.1 hypothetical protein [Streptomyces sp. G-G2]